MQSWERGFTLLELLVVIGVLGILAAVLLATIDPLEQLRKGTDSNKKEASIELVNGLTRYYATKGAFPWAASPSGDGCYGGSAPSGTKADESGFGSCFDALIAQGELKSSFKDQAGLLAAMYVTETGSGTSKSVAACFDPESKSDSLRTETKFSKLAVTASGCPAAGTECYWCAQ